MRAGDGERMFHSADSHLSLESTREGCVDCFRLPTDQDLVIGSWSWRHPQGPSVFASLHWVFFPLG